MNPSDVRTTAVREGDGAGLEEPSRVPESGRGALPSASRQVREPDRRTGWTGGRITALVVGVLLVLVSLPLLGGGGTAVWADATQRDAGYVTSSAHELSTSGSALATEPVQLGSAGVGWLYSARLLGEVRIRVTPVGHGPALFVGIGRSTDVDRYLAGVAHTVVSDFFGDEVKSIEGGRPRSAPGSQRFWVASTDGAGPQTLTWDPRGGSWTAVVMNADARPGIRLRADIGASFPAVLWIAIGLLAAGAVFLTGGGLLIAGAIRGRRAGRANSREGRR